MAVADQIRREDLQKRGDAPRHLPRGGERTKMAALEEEEKRTVSCPPRSTAGEAVVETIRVTTAPLPLPPVEVTLMEDGREDTGEMGETDLGGESRINSLGLLQALGL